MRRTLLAEATLGDGRRLQIVTAEPGDADVLARVIIEAFSSRPPVDPPPPALSETPQAVEAALAGGFGVLALVEDEPAGVVIVSIEGGRAGIHRVSVRPGFQQHGVASVMLAVVLEALSLRSIRRVELVARAEFPQVVSWWTRQGFTEQARSGTSITLSQVLPVSFAAPTADDTRALGRRLAALLRRGDLIIASGDLGAGKTTLTQGLGEGLDVGGAVISPTFVLSRVHRARGEGPDLVHVDAYRLGSAAELDDLDLDASTEDSVTLVEWGTGIAEGLSEDRLEVDIRRSLDPSDETRWIFLNPVGERWRGIREALEAL
jgi:tRNA threonylcarbamoyladenosine biosynthesis protein TsaE